MPLCSHIWHRLPSALQAALQSKRLELRASVLDSMRSVLLQQPRAGEEAEIWVHNGFLEAYASVRSEVLRLLQHRSKQQAVPFIAAGMPSGHADVHCPSPRFQDLVDGEEHEMELPLRCAPASGYWCPVTCALPLQQHWRVAP